MSSKSKTDRYSSKVETDSLEDLSNKLAEDLRKHIRKLASFPLFADAWFEMADVLGRVANVSDMESNLAAGKEDKTLWETEEQALRFLLEDGKLNLCLKNLIEFKQHQRRARVIGSGPIFDFAVECDKFERGLGIILKNAWSHVEALQTSDLIGLMNHIADVIEGALEAPELLRFHIKAGDLHQRQEIVVFYYLYDVMRHLDEIGENRIMPTIRERGIFMLSINLIERVHAGILGIHTLKALGALSLMVGTEDFSTYTSQHIKSDNVATLVEFKTSCLAPFQTDFENRKVIRPLIDCIDRAKRQNRLK